MQRRRSRVHANEWFGRLLIVEPNRKERDLQFVLPGQESAKVRQVVRAQAACDFAQATSGCCEEAAQQPTPFLSFSIHSLRLTGPAASRNARRTQRVMQ
jgi:hypothetical protein